jgi:hypothetical protein
MKVIRFTVGRIRRCILVMARQQTEEEREKGFTFFNSDNFLEFE